MSIKNSFKVATPSLRHIQNDFKQQLINRPDFKDRLMELAAIDQEDYMQALEEYPRFIYLFCIKRGDFCMPSNIAAVHKVDMQFGYCATWLKFTQSTLSNYPEPPLFDIDDIDQCPTDILLAYQRTRSEYWKIFGHPSPKPTWPNPLERFEADLGHVSILTRIFRVLFATVVCGGLLWSQKGLFEILINLNFEEISFFHILNFIVAAFMMLVFVLLFIVVCPQCKKFGTFISSDPITEGLQKNKIEYHQCSHCKFAWWKTYNEGGGGGGG